MKNILLILGLLAAVAASPQSKENPGSVYRDGATNPIRDNVARQVGDLLTVIVKEESLATYAASTKTDKSDSNRINVDFFNSFLNGIFRPFSTGATQASDGKGDTSYSSKMTSRLSVIVREVMPNGTLVVEGTRSLVTNKQTQTLVFSGLVRPLDIKADNTVESTKVAEAQVRMEGKGSIQDRQRKGILTQLLDWLF